MDDDDLGFRFPYTAVGYQLGLTLLALRSTQRSQAWRNDAMRRLPKWDIDFEKLLRSIPIEERKRKPPDLSYRGPRYPINPRSPYLFRRKRSMPKDSDSTWVTGIGIPRPTLQMRPMQDRHIFLLLPVSNEENQITAPRIPLFKRGHRTRIIVHRHVCEGFVSGRIWISSVQTCICTRNSHVMEGIRYRV